MKFELNILSHHEFENLLILIQMGVQKNKTNKKYMEDIDEISNS